MEWQWEDRFPSLPVHVDQDGQLGTVDSSRRFKKDIKPMDQASEGILKLKPVTFHYKDRDNKNDQTPQYGLIAEDVAAGKSRSGRIWQGR